MYSFNFSIDGELAAIQLLMHGRWILTGLWIRKALHWTVRNTRVVIPIVNEMHRDTNTSSVSPACDVQWLFTRRRHDFRWIQRRWTPSWFDSDAAFEWHTHNVADRSLCTRSRSNNPFHCTSYQPYPIPINPLYQSHCATLLTPEQNEISRAWEMHGHHARGFSWWHVYQEGTPAHATNTSHS